MSMLPNLVNDLMIDSDEDDEIILNEGADEDFQIPDVEVVDHISQDDIFVKPKSKVKAVKTDTVPVVEPIKKQKKVISEEHKAKMKAGREKKKKERLEMNQLERKATIKLNEKKKKEYEDILNDVPKPRPTAEIDPNVIQKAIDEAITKHETLRQQRKAAKRAALDEAVQKKKVEEEIRSALYPAKLYHTDSGFYSKHIFNTK
jgi:hypothetical protein